MRKTLFLLSLCLAFGHALRAAAQTPWELERVRPRSGLVGLSALLGAGEAVGARPVRLYDESHAPVIGMSDHRHPYWGDLGGVVSDEKGPAVFAAKAINMNRIISLAANIKSKHVLPILNSCFSGSLIKAAQDAPPAVAGASAGAPARLTIERAGETADALPPHPHPLPPISYRISTSAEARAHLFIPPGTDRQLANDDSEFRRKFVPLVKNFFLKQRDLYDRKLTFHLDVFNLTNRANFGIPARHLEAPGFGRAVSSVTPARRLQFSLKLSFYDSRKAVMDKLRTSTSLAATKAVGVIAAVVLAAWPAAGQGGERADVRPLPFGETVEREMSEQVQHFYILTLKQGEALQVDLTEKGVNCVVLVIDNVGPTPQRVLGADFGTGFGRETVTYIARRAGEYVVGVGVHRGEAPGRYVMVGRVIPVPSAEQQSRGDAVRVLDEGFALVNAARDAKSLHTAAAKLQDALSLWKELKEDYWVATTANLLGKILADLDKKARAVESLELALELFRKLGDKSGRANAASNLGVVYGEFGEYGKGLKFFSESLALAEEIGNQKERASLLVSMGALRSARGYQREALEHYEKALQILKVAPSDATESRALSGIAILYAKSGEAAKALSSLNRALELTGQSTDVNARPKLLNDIGEVYGKLGKTRQALEYQRQALSLYEQNGNRRGQATVSSNIGSFYFSLGEFGEARNYLLRALAIYEETGDDVGAALVSHNLAGVYKLVGDTKEMERHLLRAMDLLKGKESENMWLYSNLLILAGAVLVEGGEKYMDAAIETYQGVIDISRDIGHKSNEALALISLADLYFYKGDNKKGAEIFSRGFLAAISSEEQEIEASALNGLMVCWRWTGNPDLAIFYGKQALNKHQELRTHIRGLDSETQKSYVRKNSKTYGFLANMLLRRGRYAEALQVINASQDQQFYDFSRDNAAPARPIDLTPREATFAATLRQTSERVVAAARQLEEFKRRAEGQPSPEGAGQLARIEAELKAASEEFSAALEQAAADFSRPPREGENVSRATDLSDVQLILRELSAVTGRKTVAFYPLASAEEFRVLLVTPDSAFTAANPILDDVFDKKVLQYYALLQTPALDPRPLGKELYDLIVKPMEPALRAAGAQTLLWSPGGMLRYVPIASLWDGKKYLVERFENAVFTRADRERMTRAVSREWAGVGFGNSREHSIDLLGDGNRVDFQGLPGVSEELSAIFRPAGRDGVVKGEVFMDNKFTKASFLSLAERRPTLVHVASHFSFRPGDDTQSFLLLGDGTALTLNEMKGRGRLFEGVELLTLSACETAATRADAMGREIDGFAESAQRLGAAAVMATLWTVADDSTPRLMREFYRARQGIPLLTKAEALRRAQLALLNGTSGGVRAPAARASGPTRFKVELVDALGGGKRRALSYTGRGRGAEIIYIEKSQAPAFKAGPDKPFAHPYYWAPFILIGNWR